MKILPFSSAGWLFFTCTIYLLAGLIDIWVYRFAPTECIQAVWLLIMAMPLFVKMKWLVRVDTVWEQTK